MNKRIQILDCTLRDGGLGLEDGFISGISDVRFSKEDRTDIALHLAKSDADIIEIGSLEISGSDKTGFAIYQSIEEASAVMPQKNSDTQMFAALYRGPDTPAENIPKWHKGLCEAVRVIIRYSELQKSLDFCRMLSEKGYKVFVQPMLTMRYTDEELDLIIRESNAMNAYALYFVDSYGYMQNNDVDRLFRLYDEKLDPEIRIGFHAHNNMNLAFSNVLYMMSIKTDRNIIIDSCAMGMGQGAGNLQTELITGYLNNNGSDYNIREILDVCEITEKYYGDLLWGYSVTRLLPALKKTAYKYALAFRNRYKLTYSEIYDLLNTMPDDMRHRYTPQCAETIIREYGKGC